MSCRGFKCGFKTFKWQLADDKDKSDLSSAAANQLQFTITINAVININGDCSSCRHCEEYAQLPQLWTLFEYPNCFGFLDFIAFTSFSSLVRLLHGPHVGHTKGTHCNCLKDNQNEQHFCARLSREPFIMPVYDLLCVWRIRSVVPRLTLETWCVCCKIK